MGARARRQALGEALALPSLTQKVGTMRVHILQERKPRRGDSLSGRGRPLARAQSLRPGTCILSAGHDWGEGLARGKKTPDENDVC